MTMDVLDELWKFYVIHLFKQKQGVKNHNSLYFVWGNERAIASYENLINLINLITTVIFISAPTYTFTEN